MLTNNFFLFYSYLPHPSCYCIVCRLIIFHLPWLNHICLVLLLNGWLSLCQHCVKLQCSASYPILCTGPLPVYAAHCILNAAEGILHTARCILHTARCILHTVRCILHTARCILHTAHCILHTLHNVYSTLDTVSFIQHTAVPFP